jgi:hypothetical protein
MSQLDDATLMELGRFAIQASGFDELITTLAADVLECAEWRVALERTSRMTAGPKLDQLKTICSVLAELYGVDLQLHEAVEAQIAAARKIIEDRNTVIHGKLSFQPGKRPVFQLNKKPTVEMSQVALSEFVKRMSQCEEELWRAYLAFNDAVHKKRKVATSKAR